MQVWILLISIRKKPGEKGAKPVRDWGHGQCWADTSCGSLEGCEVPPAVPFRCCSGRCLVSPGWTVELMQAALGLAHSLLEGLWHPGSLSCRQKAFCFPLL